MEIINNVSHKKYGIAVFVLSFNQAQFIEEALQSILEQHSETPFHIFINDDASTDGSQLILRRYAAEYPALITVILQSENQYNRGITIGIDLFRYSNSDFIAFCEADDFWSSPSKLGKQLDFLNRFDFCSLVHSPVNILNSGASKKVEKDLKRHLRKNLPNRKYVSGDFLCNTNFIFTNSVMIRRSSIPEILISDAGPLMPLDYIIFALSTRFGSIGLIDEKLSTYRLHENNYWASENPVFENRWRDTKDFINQFSPYDFE